MMEQSNWYILEDNQVKGPFATQQLRDVCSSFSKDALISRTPNKNWRPISDIYKLLEVISEKDTELERLKQTFFQNAPISLSLQSEATTPKVKAEPLTAKQQTVQVAAVSESIRDVALNNAPRALQLAILKARLRLSDPRNPLFSSLLVLLSGGILKSFWMRSVYKELNWYAANSLSLEHFPALWYLMVPFTQCSVFHRLACFLQALEMHEGAVTLTKPKLAYWLSLFSPLAVFYLQRRINKFWHLKLTNAAP